jgi:hypothetical protein
MEVEHPQADDHVPPWGRLAMGLISVLCAVIAGSFMSFVFYYFRGCIELPLYYIHRDWMTYSGDIAWTLGFLSGVLMVLFGKSRWQRMTPKQRARRERSDKEWEEEKKRRKPVTSIDGVVTRTTWGILAGAVVGLVLAFVLEMIFMSISIGPIAPKSWEEAVKIEWRRERESFNTREETTMGISSSHPLFKYLFFVPVCSMPVLGGGIGCVTAVRSWMRQ